MENTHTPSTETKNNYVSLKFRKPKPMVWGIIAAIIVVILVVVLTKSFFVAASVNGDAISRWSVVKELEKQGGKQALEAMISNSLIESELDNQKVVVEKEVIDASIDKIRTQVTSQGGTFEEILAQQGLTEESFREQITLQERVKKLFAEASVVTPAEIDAYIKDSKAVPPKDMTVEAFRTQIGEMIMQQKFQQEAQKWVTDLKTQAKIKYYVTY